MSPKDIIIAVMGITGSGKTTFISRCMGEDVGIGHGLHSFTQDVAIHSFRRRGRTIHLIDTPGFDDTTKSDVNVLNNIAFWLSHAYRAEPKLLLSGVIYLHPISEPKMVGTATRNLAMMKLLCGEENLSIVWLATTMWGLVSPERGLGREQELMSTDQFWGGLIRRGSKVCRHQDTETSAFAIVDHIIAQHQPMALSIQRQMVDEHRDVDQTDAGRYLRQNVIREQEKVQNRLARSTQELEEKLDAQEAAEVEEVIERQRGYQQKLEEKTKSLTAMKLDMNKLREQKAQELAEREKAFAREKAAQDAKMAELNQQVRDLQAQRDDVVKWAQADAENRRKLEDTNLQLLILNDKAAIAGIDRAIADRQREEEQVQHKRQQVVKQEGIFRHTMKVSLAQTFIHGAFHVAAAVCIVM
jgi:50S ribosome-binding GTPase